MDTLPDIYAYLDYHKYFVDVFAVLRVTKATSRRAFGRLAGSTSPNFLQLILARKMHPSDANLRRLGKALHLDAGRQRYLLRLVAFARAKTPDQRYRLLRVALKQAGVLQPHQLQREQYEYYSQWYYSAARALVGCSRLRKGPEGVEEVASRLGIRKNEARAALELLEKLRLIRVDREGCYEQAQALITTGPEVRSMQVLDFQRQTMQLAMRALDECPTLERDISTLTLNISGQGVADIKERVRSFRREIMDMAAHDPRDDRVYQLNVQFFPLARGPKP